MNKENERKLLRSSAYNGTKEIYVACGELMGKNVEEFFNIFFSFVLPAIIFSLYLSRKQLQNGKIESIYLKPKMEYCFWNLNFLFFGFRLCFRILI